MLGKALDAMPADALQRIVDAPLERWTTGEYAEYDMGRCLRCLNGHVVQAGYAEPLREITERLDDVYARVGMDRSHVETAFDSLGYRFTLPRIVPLIQARAAKALAHKETAQ